MSPIWVGVFAFGLTVVFTAYGAAVRANRLETRGIVGFGTAIGLLATIASYFVLSSASKKPVPPASLLTNSLVMSLCTGFVIAQALRRHRIDVIDTWDIQGVPLVVQQCQPMRIQGYDTWIVPCSGRLFGDFGAAGAVLAAGGRGLEAVARTLGPIPLERTVMVAAEKLPADRIAFCSVHEPGKSVDPQRLRRVVDNAVVQAGKVGARRVAIVTGSLRGCEASAIATAMLPAARHAAKFDAFAWVAVDSTTAEGLRSACAGRGDARIPVASGTDSPGMNRSESHDGKSP